MICLPILQCKNFYKSFIMILCVDAATNGKKLKRWKMGIFHLLKLQENMMNKINQSCFYPALLLFMLYEHYLPIWLPCFYSSGYQ